MSLLKKLFGRKSGAERLNLAERLLAEGAVGDARLELEAALGAPDLPASERPRAEQLLSQAGDRLARDRVQVAEALAEAGETDEAAEALELAAELARDPALAAQVAQRLEDLRALSGTRLEAGPYARVLSEPCHEEACSIDAGGEEVEGDGLDPLELALLAYPEQEADELAALAAREPAVERALVSLAEGRAAHALAQWQSLGESVARGGLVLRERARAALMAGEADQAAAALDEILPLRGEDPDTLALLMEARLALGDQQGAAAIARQSLDKGLARDLTLAVGVLAEGGEPEQALAAVDRALEGDGQRSAGLWELRGLMCQQLGRAEDAQRADKRALERFQAECSGCGSRSPQFPLSSARRLAERYSAVPSEITRERFVDLLRLLIAHDTELAEQWVSLLKGVGG